MTVSLVSWPSLRLYMRHRARSESEKEDGTCMWWTHTEILFWESVRVTLLAAQTSAVLLWTANCNTVAEARDLHSHAMAKLCLTGSNHALQLVFLLVEFCILLGIDAGRLSANQVETSFDSTCKEYNTYLSRAPGPLKALSDQPRLQCALAKGAEFAVADFSQREKTVSWRCQRSGRSPIMANVRFSFLTFRFFLFPLFSLLLLILLLKWLTNVFFFWRSWFFLSFFFFFFFFFFFEIRRKTCAKNFRKSCDPFCPDRRPTCQAGLSRMLVLLVTWCLCKPCSCRGGPRLAIARGLALPVRTGSWLRSSSVEVQIARSFLKVALSHLAFLC